MQRDEIIDAGRDPQEVRRAFWRGLLRYGLPAAGILLVTAGLIGSTLYTNAMNRTDVSALADDLIASLDARVQTRLRAYLEPAQTAVGALAAAVPSRPLSESGREIFERLSLDLLARHPQLASAYLGTAEGEFLMVRRNEAGSADTKLIRRGGGAPQVTWTRRDASGQVIATETDPTDRYDPRSRAWYGAAVPGGGIAWSKVYIFFTDKRPGITVSLAVAPRVQPAAVVGADIPLSSLSDFLAELQKSARGLLAIVNAEGELVAFHEPERIMVEEEGGLRPRTIQELGLTNLAQAFDRLRVEGADRSVIEIAGERYVFSASSLQGAVSRDWWLMLLAPEDAYLGFIAVNGQRGLLAASGIVVLSVILAGLLIYQGLLAERRAKAVTAGRAELADQRRVFDQLAELTDLSDPEDDADLRSACEILARSQSARRAGVWRLLGGEGGLLCLNAYDAETQGHTGGMRIERATCEELFDEMAEGRAVEALDALSDARAAGLRATYLQAVEASTLDSLPILSGGRALGAIWLEDAAREAAPGARSVARNVANLLAPRLQALAAQAPAAPRPRAAGKVTTPGAPGRQPAQARTLRQASLIDLRRDFFLQGGKGAAPGAAVYKDVTVLVLKLLDDHALAACPSGSSDGAVIRAVVNVFKEAAADGGAPYLKILTDQVIGVDGFDGDTGAAAARLVDIALAVRERCNDIFLAAGIGPQFTLGIDSGTVFGSEVGFGDSPYNIWGEAVRVAVTMADTAEPGSIQVSEATYELLREDCVFRRRGAFYLGDLGEMSTFTLRSRL